MILAKQLQHDLECLVRLLDLKSYALTFDASDNIQVWPRFAERPVNAELIRTYPFSQEGIGQAFIQNFR